MKLSTELKDLPIVSIAEGEEVGMVKDFIVDPVEKAVVALVIADKTWYAGAKVISFSLINSIGDYAITTENSSSVVELSNMPEIIDLLKKELKMIDARVITRGGRFVGRVNEYSIDPETGRILGLELAGDADVSSPDKNVIPSASIVTIGKDVIIVNDDVESSLTSGHASLSATAYSVPKARPAAPRPAPKPAAAPRPAAPPPAFDETEIGSDIEADLGLMDEEPAPAPKSRPAPAMAPADDEVDIEELLDLDSEAEVSGLIDEPAPRANEAPVLEEPETETKESLSAIFERRQIQFMLGKKASRDIETDDGIAIASKGQVITDDIIKKAKSAGKFLELSMNIEIEE